MIRTWISAAAAAGSLRRDAARSHAQQLRVSTGQTWAQHRPQSERARIVGIANEVRRLVVRFAEAETTAVVAPRPARPGCGRTRAGRRRAGSRDVTSASTSMTPKQPPGKQWATSWATSPGAHARDLARGLIASWHGGRDQGSVDRAMHAITTFCVAAEGPKRTWACVPFRDSPRPQGARAKGRRKMTSWVVPSGDDSAPKRSKRWLPGKASRLTRMASSAIGAADGSPSRAPRACRASS